MSAIAYLAEHIRSLVALLRPGGWTRGVNVRKRLLIGALAFLTLLTAANVAVGVLFGSCGVLHSPTIAGISTVGGFILRDLGIRTIWQSN